ncbi:MAG TPA: tetratricopeptide repeat protein, partial [Saprospiraceae bacterium]|nr:tetratricopeptide repeat protein [Saprospiraceae bacterium]
MKYPTMTKQELSAIEQLIAQGNLEPALEQLLLLLNREPLGAELAQIVRVNQADFYQLKGAMLKGTVAPEDARLTTNQINDSALQVLRRLKEGKYTLTDVAADRSPRPAVWRYYVAGGVVALTIALLVWRFMADRKAGESCPKFEPQTRYRVMVLPFKQTGTKKGTQPEIDIADGLNVLIARTPGLKNIAEAIVHKRFDIDGSYPNFNQAADIAEGCDAQMVVWGKINQDDQDEYKLDIRYKLVGAGNVQTGDTTLSNLLRMQDQGRNLVQDVEAVTRLMYIVLANQAKVSVLPSLIAEATPSARSDSAAAMRIDSSLWLGIAQNQAQNKQTDKAIATYTRVLEAFPDNVEARVKRGSLLYERGDYAAAARDLEAAAPDAASAQPELLKIRVDARLQSGQPSKAKEDLKSLRERAKTEDARKEQQWIDQKSQQVKDSITALQRVRDQAELLAKTKPQDTRVRTVAAQA